MKTLCFYILMIVCSYPSLLNGQEKQFDNSLARDNTDILKVIWEKQHIDVGYVMQNKPITVNYTFTNDGDQPLVIEDITTSCGCTAAKHSQEPVLPGESSSIAVTYNAGKPGAFHKSVRVKTSADENYTVLTISGEVQ